MQRHEPQQNPSGLIGLVNFSLATKHMGTSWPLRCWGSVVKGQTDNFQTPMKYVKKVPRLH